MTKQTVTEQLKAIASIVEDLANTLERDPKSGKEVAELIKAKAKAAKLEVGSVRVLREQGSTIVKIVKNICPGTKECLKEVLPLVTDLLKRKLTMAAECGRSCKETKCRLIMTVEEQFSVETGMANAAKDKSGVSGDASDIIPLEHGKIAMILSDGMGSGEVAAGESILTVGLLRKLLVSGFDVHMAVKTVNSLMLLKAPTEKFATVDILIVDTNSGEAEFVKAGSAPSYIKRFREVATIKSESLPVGIMQTMEIEPTRWRLAADDKIIMLSDGIADIPGPANNREPWVVNFLRRCDDSIPPADMAEIILRQAQLLAGVEHRDDMTVMVVSIGQRKDKRDDGD